MELVGLLPPKGQRDAVQASFAKHVQEFIGDLKAKGRNGKYIDQEEHKLELLSAACGWQSVKDVTPDSFIRWRSGQKLSPKTLNEHLASVKGLLNWMVAQGRLASNPLASVQKVETRGREVRPRRAYTDEEVSALLNVAGKYRLPCLTAALTGLRHGELKQLRWGDLNLSVEKPSVLVRASISKNHKQACLPLHPVLLAKLAGFRHVDAADGDLVFPDMLPRPDVFSALLKKAGITKTDSQGRVVDFHSLRHTFCTNLHRAGVPQREAMELMRHNDPRLTANTYADASLFSLREAVAKLPWKGLADDAQRDAQRNDFPGTSFAKARDTRFENLHQSRAVERASQETILLFERVCVRAQQLDVSTIQPQFICLGNCGSEVYRATECQYS
ncbi:MAG: site-specific integrase [Verrucomicrobiia bacterium]